jgi:hypothetical protein
MLSGDDGFWVSVMELLSKGTGSPWSDDRTLNAANAPSEWPARCVFA